MTRFYLPEAYGELNEGISQVLFTEDEIQARVLAIGQAISRDYEGCHPLMVGVLKGVFPFMSDLLRAITIPVEVDFMAIASYSSQARDKGYVRLQKDLDESIAGRHVLFVEDVVDTGLTLNYLLGNLRARQPASLKVCALFNKSRRRLISVPLQYKGFDLPDKFVVGYGLDYRELYRNLPFVGLLKPTVFAPNGS
ncbi:MAG: hypoxanthine phosphoribosyltransferase [Chloroflexi bacterium]|nr:hypoxanthine phosphoribosyltransferase [Chloroflexota bacterium]MBK7918669.1 hypoxanthine phosphoribosyltransferase [Chloroflexota bacterium]